MKWDVGEGMTEIGKGAKVYLDGVEVQRVTAFDTDEGWVEHHCLDAHTGHPGNPHLSPDNPDRVCTVRGEGHVVFVPGEGATT